MHRAIARFVLPALATLAMLWSAQPVAGSSPAYPDQSLGDRGANVRAVQHLLREHGSTVVVNGIFGPVTVLAVQDFQRSHGLSVNGRADRPTWLALRDTVAAGSHGEAVFAVQRLLNEKRHAGLALTGAFDRATAAAVRSFQRHAGIDPIAVVGPATWRALVAHFELPTWSAGLCDYSVGNGPANWGTSAAIGAIESAARRMVATGRGRIALGDIGFEHGGDIPGHVTHEQGLDVDLRPMRDARTQCRSGTNWRFASYDRRATRALIKTIRAYAPGHVRLIYFNDPVLIREGLTRWYAGHDDHLHVRFCEAVHPVPAYVC